MNELLRSMEQLSAKDLETIAKKVSHLQARQKPVLPETESELLMKINEGLTEAEWKRYHQLVEKRRSETIKKKELEELIATTDKLEWLNARRLESVYKLSVLRKVPAETLIKQLGIYKPFNVL